MQEWIQEWLQELMQEWIQDAIQEWIQDWSQEWIQDAIQEWIQDWIQEWIEEWIQDWMQESRSPKCFKMQEKQGPKGRVQGARPLAGGLNALKCKMFQSITQSIRSFYRVLKRFRRWACLGWPGLAWAGLG